MKLRSNFVSTLLPKDARDALVKASQVDPSIEPGLSFDRAKAVDRALARIKSQYPNLFQKGALI